MVRGMPENSDCQETTGDLERRGRIAYREHHKRLTPQRLAVLRALSNLPQHPTAEQIYQRVVDLLPTVSLRTVYAILHELESMRLIQSLPSTSGGVRWDPDPRPHAHLACSRCGTMYDLPVDPMVLASLARRTGRSTLPSHAVLIFFAVCGQCHRQASEPG